MTASLSQRIEDVLKNTDNLYHRLLLVVGRRNAGKTAALREISSRQGWPLVNINLTLSESLINLTTPMRALKVDSLMNECIRKYDSEVVLLDNIEILFSPQLQTDPLRLLQGFARNQKLVAAWPGELKAKVMTYAEPGHPEFRRYENPEAVLVPAGSDAQPNQHIEIGESL